MNNEIKYPITIQKKVPFVSEFLLTALLLCLIVVGVCLFAFLPSLRSSNEMKVVVGLNSIPENIKWLILYSGIGLLIFRLIYKYIQIHSEAIFSFNSNSFIINIKDTVYEIPASSITKIEIVDPINRSNEVMGKFHVIIYSRNQEPLKFQLKIYNDSYSFVDNLLLYDNLSDRIRNLDRLFLSESYF